jgi:hypothetical protein
MTTDLIFGLFRKITLDFSGKPVEKNILIFAV